MSEISAVSGGSQAISHQAAAVKLLGKALEIQTEAISDLLASMGLGQNIDIEA